MTAILVERVRRMIDFGELSAGDRVNEVAVSEALGVSRTPLREALNRLAASHVVEVRPRHGFFVPPLSKEELLHAYRVRPILDCAALELAGLAAAARLEELETLNRRYLAARAVDRRIDLDDRFHLALVESCGNPVLLDLIRAMMDRTRRYEAAYLARQSSFSRSGVEHDAILGALRAGDLPGAREALRINLTSGLEPMAQWLSEQTKPS